MQKHTVHFTRDGVISSIDIMTIHPDDAAGLMSLARFAGWEFVPLDRDAALLVAPPLFQRISGVGAFDRERRHPG
jgi:hypothetical protein